MEGKIELPRDVNGVPIKPGDTVYKAPGKDSFAYGENCITPMVVKSLELMNNSEWWVNIYDRNLGHTPSVLTHVPPDNLESIKEAINWLVHYARRMGSDLSEEEVKKEISDLMKRIKTMMERER